MEAVDYESQLHPEPEQQANLELTYLTPVFRNDEKNETNIMTESEFIADISMYNRRISQQPTNESKLTSDNLQDHVYIEVLKDNIARSGVHKGPDGENLYMKSNRKQ